MATQYGREEVYRYIDNQCYKCCGLKKPHIELYKLTLPANVVNIIVDFYFVECENCCAWRGIKWIIDITLDIKEDEHKNVEDDVLIFLAVYNRKLPPFEYTRQFMKISQKRYDMLKDILHEFHYDFELDDVKEYVKTQFIKRNKLSLKNVEKQLNQFLKLTFEHNKEHNTSHQLDFYPEIRLM